MDARKYVVEFNEDENGLVESKYFADKAEAVKFAQENNGELYGPVNED